MYRKLSLMFTPPALAVVAIVMFLIAVMHILVQPARAADPDRVTREAWRAAVSTNTYGMAAGKIIVGDVDGTAAAVDMSGDALIDSNGVVTVAKASDATNRLAKVEGKIGTAASIVDLSVSASTAVTNGGTLTVANSVMLVDSMGGAAETTNTIVLANATVTGRFVQIINVGSNAIEIAQTGNWLSPALYIEELSSATIIAGTTNTWYGK